MPTPLRAAFGAVVVSVLACSPTGVVDDVDGGANGSDAGSLTDAGFAPTDAGSTPNDAGSTPNDAGSTPNDAGSTPNDAGPTPNDAGSTPNDAGPTLNDAGPTPNDAGPTPNDAGPTPNDAGPTPNDAGSTPIDAGSFDAGQRDAGSTPTDAGSFDAGHRDGGSDAGWLDPSITWGAPAAIREGVFYQVYVRSFADSAADSGVGAIANDGIGDLPGLTARLDYIASLGVTGILLLPLFVDANPETGGYLTVDPFHISPQHGGDAAFTAFVAQAHARNLKVVLDLSFSVVSRSHPWFVSARQSTASPQRPRFVRTAMDGGACPMLLNLVNQNGWTAFDAGPADRECFWCDYASPGASSVPCAAPDVEDSVVAQTFFSVAQHWMMAGADGFRLDSAASVAQVTTAAPLVRNQSSPATHRFWRDFMHVVKRQNPNAFAMAELFDPTGYFSDGIDVSTDYLTWLGLTWSWQNRLARSPANEGLGDLLPYQVQLRTPLGWGAGFIGNHDVPGHDFAGRGSGRIADLFCPLPCTDVAPLRSAALLQFGLPATPFVYYGEELGLHGGVDRDGRLWSRNPMPWTGAVGRGFTTASPWTPLAADPVNVQAQAGVAGSLLETYRGLITARRNSSALSRGGFTMVTTSNPAFLGFVRASATERILVLTNFDATAASTTVNLGAASVPTGPVSEYLFGSAQTALTAQNLTQWPIAMPPRSTL
jgi:glycosidase